MLEESVWQNTIKTKTERRREKQEQQKTPKQTHRTKQEHTSKCHIIVVLFADCRKTEVKHFMPFQLYCFVHVQVPKHTLVSCKILNCSASYWVNQHTAPVNTSCFQKPSYYQYLHLNQETAVSKDETQTAHFPLWTMAGML